MSFRKWLLRPLFFQLSRMEIAIMTTAAELAKGLTDLTTQVAKIGDETTALKQNVADLEAALANGGTVSPDVQAAFDALKARVQTVDDLVPDASTTTPPAESTPPADSSPPADGTPAP